MNHVVYVDYKDGEMEKLLSGKKTMIIRGAMGKKMPYGRVRVGEALYFVNNNGEGKIVARGKVSSVFESDKLSKEESITLVEKQREVLRIGDRLKARFAGKRYIVLVKVAEIDAIEPLELDRSKFGNMDDWIPFQELEEVIK